MCVGRTSYIIGLFRDMLYCTKSETFSPINFSVLTKAIAAAFSPRVAVWGPCHRRVSAKNWSEWRWPLSFKWRRQLVVVTHNVWNKTPESIFQIIWGQWSTFVQPGSISCCFLWVKYGVKARLAPAVATAADIQWRKMQWHIYAKWRQ